MHNGYSYFPERDCCFYYKAKVGNTSSFISVCCISLLCFWGLGISVVAMGILAFIGHEDATKEEEKWNVIIDKTKNYIHAPLLWSVRGIFFLIPLYFSIVYQTEIKIFIEEKYKKILYSKKSENVANTQKKLMTKTYSGSKPIGEIYPLMVQASKENEPEKTVFKHKKRENTTAEISNIPSNNTPLEQPNYKKHISDTWIIKWKNGKAGYVDKAGKWKISPQFSDARPFSQSGYASVAKNNKYGVINYLGKWILKPQFKYPLEYANNGLASLKHGNKWGFIDVKGNWIVKPVFDEVSEFSHNGLALAKLSYQDNYGFINKKGEWIISPQYLRAKPFSSNGLALACLTRYRGKCGFINEQDRWVVLPKFYELEPFSDNGLALAKLNANDNSGFINSQGNWVITPKPFVFRSFSKNGLAMAWKNHKMGFVDSKGNWAIVPQFDEGYEFSNGLALVRKGNYWRSGNRGYIDSNGEIAIRIQFDSGSHPFGSNGLAQVSKKNKKFCIDKKGNYVKKPPCYGQW